MNAEKIKKVIPEEDAWGWIIDRDYITPKGEECYRVGKKTNDYFEQDQSKRIRFRCLDDDGNVYYGGWLIDNDDCDAQDSILDFTMNDAGCVEVQVKRNGEWVTEIG